MTTKSLPQRNQAAEWALAAAILFPLALAAAASRASGAWWWGFDSPRYLPAWAWVLWALPLVALAFTWRKPAGGAERRIPAVTLVCAVLAAGLVLAFPDRVQFVGDFLLRQGTSEEALPPSSLFPQALPLDTFLHVVLPTWAHGAFGVPSTVVSRILDALEAGGLVVLGFAFAKRAGLKGKEALACAALASWGGWVALFTGYSKAFTEMSLLVLACAADGVDALRGSKRGYWFLCVTVAIGFALHRSAVGFLPALAFATWFALKREVPSKAPRGKKSKAKQAPVPEWLPLLVPGTMLAIALPKMIESATKLDTAHFAAHGEGPLSVVRQMVSPIHLLDLFNLTFFLVPLAALVLIPAPKSERSGPWSAREWIYFVALGAPFWLIALVLRPAQGIPRDFDVFAPAGVALGVIGAARLARLWRAAPATSRFATAILAGAMAPVLCVLLLQSDLARGLVRVNALADGPPLRSETERARWREYLGARYHRAKRYKEAVAEFAQAAALAPSPNILAAWGIAARWANDQDSEERAFTMLLERAPADRVAIRVAALTGLARIALERGDRAKANQLVMQALALDPEATDAQSLAQRLAAGGP